MEFRTEKIGIFASMITAEQYSLLLTANVQKSIADNLDRNPIDVAMDKRVVAAQLVAAQVKYLQRARTKLPSYYASRCIIPALAFEQSSSEECAARKSMDGGSVLDLTCGLGVDTLYLSKRFARVVALERDADLARITAENMRRLGAANVEVVCASAENFLRTTTERFDWVYADPDRRGVDGNKQIRLEACSPDILSLRDDIHRVSGKLCVKNSPLFDVDEAFRLFGRCCVEVVSLRDECKEVVIYVDDSEPTLSAVAIGRGECSVALSDLDSSPCDTLFNESKYKWLVTPDVALQKSRMACSHLRGKADIWSNNGYGFAVEYPEGVIGRVLAIESIEDYNPREQKKLLKGVRIEILKHDFPLSTAQIIAALGVREGGDVKIAFTKIGGRFLSVRLK